MSCEIEIEIDCTCDRTHCENYKKCVPCVKSHRERGYLPHCLRPLANSPNPPAPKPEGDQQPL